MAGAQRPARRLRATVPKKKAAALRWGAAAALPEQEGRGSGNESVEALGVGRGAVRQRLERFAGELDHRFGQLRAFGDHAVERGAGQLALELEELGRRLGFGERADRVRQPARRRRGRERRRPGRSSGRLRRRCGRLRRSLRRWRGRGRPAPRRPSATLERRPGCARRHRRTCAGTASAPGSSKPGKQLVEVMKFMVLVPSICLTRRRGLRPARVVALARLARAWSVSCGLRRPWRRSCGARLARRAVVALRGALGGLASASTAAVSAGRCDRLGTAFAGASAAASIALDLGFVSHVKSSLMLQCTIMQCAAPFQGKFCALHHATIRPLDGHGPPKARAAMDLPTDATIRPPPPRPADRPVLASGRGQVDDQPDAARGRPGDHHVDQRDDPADAAGRGRRRRLSFRRRCRVRRDDRRRRVRRMGPRVRPSLRHAQGAGEGSAEGRPRHLVRHRLAGHAAARADSATIWSRSSCCRRRWPSSSGGCTRAAPTAKR